MPRQSDPARLGDIIPVLMALVIVGGLLAVFVYSMDRPVDRAKEAASRPMPDPTDEPAPRPGIDATRRPEPSAPRQAPPAVPSRPSSDDRRRLAKLKALCRQWTEKNTRGQYEGLQTQACADMQRFAQQTNQAAPGVTIRQAPSQPRSATRSDRVAIYVEECERFGYGSIRYRECRADEKERLRRQCRKLTNQLDVVQAETNQYTRARKRAWCGAYSRYQVVK